MYEEYIRAHAAARSTARLRYGWARRVVLRAAEQRSTVLGLKQIGFQFSYSVDCAYSVDVHTYKYGCTDICEI